MLADRLRMGKALDLTLIAGTVGTAAGSMTGGNGLTGAFSNGGTYAQSPTTSGFGSVGKIWASPKYLGKATMQALGPSPSWWAACSQGSTHAIQIQGSNNTTNGVDGTWTALWTSPTFSNHDAAYATVTADISNPEIDAEVYYIAHRFYIYTVGWDGISIGCLVHGITHLDFYEWA